MKKALQHIPFYCFLLGPSIIFFLYTHNYPDVFLESTLRSLLISICISGILFGIIYFLVKKNQHKAGFIAFLILIPLFSYGLFYEFLEALYFSGNWPFANIHRYLLLFLTLFYGIIYIFLSYVKRIYSAITFPINTFIVIIIIINGVNLFAKDKTTPVSNLTESDSKKIKHPLSDTFPDIYYIILDGYANDQILKKFYNYSNNSLTSFLKQNKFYLANESRGNYLVTSESLASSLNHMYLDSLIREKKVATELVYKNKVSLYLKQKRYKIIHVNSGYSVTDQNYYADKNISLKSLSEFERTLLKYTIFRLDDLIGYTQYCILKEQFSSLYDLIKIKGPKFTFIHIVSPHPPYVCDENGNFKRSTRLINSWWQPKEDYVSQTKYVNRSIQEFITALLSNQGKNPIIIVQSDHGPWIKNNSLTNVYNARSLILNAYYIPYPWKSKLYNTITPVNSFPFIFNNLFTDSISILKDIVTDSIGMGRYTQTNVMLND